jgi:hypothetical protein
VTKGTTASRPWYSDSLRGHARTRKGPTDELADNIVRGRAVRARLRVVCADFKGVRVLPASGRSGLGTARGGPDTEASYGTRGRSGALERGRRGGLPDFFRTVTV